jgi:hypothetical protein
MPTDGPVPRAAVIGERVAGPPGYFKFPLSGGYFDMRESGMR